jgi:hypothetical protein
MKEHLPQQKDMYHRVNMFLDKALSQEDERSFLKEVKQNPTYHEVLNTEQSFRDLIRNSVDRRRASPDLIQSIKDKIRKAPI